MSRRQLTPEERSHLMNTTGGWAQAVLDTCDALTAENERLRADRVERDVWEHERSARRAAESSLAAATALLVRARKLVHGVVSEAIDAFLANQPTAQTRATWHGKPTVVWPGIPNLHEPAAPTVGLGEVRQYDGHAWVRVDSLPPLVVRPAAPAYATAAQSASELMARVNATPLPGWDDIERRTAEPTPTEKEDK